MTWQRPICLGHRPYAPWQSFSFRLRLRPRRLRHLRVAWMVAKTFSKFFCVFGRFHNLDIFSWFLAKFWIFSTCIHRRELNRQPQILYKIDHVHRRARSYHDLNKRELEQAWMENKRGRRTSGLGPSARKLKNNVNILICMDLNKRGLE